VGNFNRVKLDLTGRKRKVSGGLIQIKQYRKMKPSRKANKVKLYCLNASTAVANAAAVEEDDSLRPNQNMTHRRNQAGRLELNQSKYTASSSRVSHFQLVSVVLCFSSVKTC
jgi:hypothetical protein